MAGKDLELLRGSLCLRCVHCFRDKLKERFGCVACCLLAAMAVKDAERSKGCLPKQAAVNVTMESRKNGRTRQQMSRGCRAGQKGK